MAPSLHARPSIEGWQVCPDPDGGTPALELHTGAQIVTFRPGAHVSVSLDGGRTWHHGTRPVHSIYAATIAADVILMGLRHARAARATRHGMSVADRGRSEEERAERRAAAQARPVAGPSRAPRAARREGATRGGERRSGVDAPPQFVRFDDSAALRLALAHLDTLDPSVQGHAGNAAFFAAAVAIVRGFCLLPDGLGIVALDYYARDASPPWTATAKRTALRNAEAEGRMPWGVLLSTTAEGRALWGAWRDAGVGVRGRGRP
jgi:hypothetical protein